MILNISNKTQLSFTILYIKSQVLIQIKKQLVNNSMMLHQFLL